MASLTSPSGTRTQSIALLGAVSAAGMSAASQSPSLIGTDSRNVRVPRQQDLASTSGEERVPRTGAEA
jgi:hypothetical protein